MNKLAVFLALLLVAAVVALTCCEKKQDGARKGRRNDDVGLRDFIDYATGKTPIEKGREMKKRLREIEEKRKRQLDEVMK